MKKWIVLGLVAGAIGCGDDTQASADGPTADGSVDAPAVDARPDAAMADALACSTLLPPTTMVTQTQVAQAAPVPTGGVFVAGTYTMTADIIYTGVGGATGDTGVFHQAA